MLLRENVRVWGTARDVARLSPLRDRKNFFPLTLELSDPASIDAAFEKGTREAENFDLVVNNAGAGMFGSFESLGFEVWRKQLEAMVIGSAQVAHRAYTALHARNTGCLVNVSSVAVDYPLPFMTGYNVSKAGLSALSESLIFESRGSGVCVIDLRPGDYRTPFNQSMHPSSSALAADVHSRAGRAWEALEKNLAAAPAPERAAADLRRALWRGKSGTVYTGNFFQTRLSLWFARWAPARLRRAVAARYFGAA